MVKGCALWRHTYLCPPPFKPSENRLCSQPQVSADSRQIPEIVGRAESRDLDGILSLLRILFREDLLILDNEKT
jgi:hypothetical protein